MSKIAEWTPEVPQFWEATGKKIARKNLLISVFALILAFIVWQIWSVVAVRLNDVGFNLSKNELFTLAALPGLTGATLRLVYTFMPGLIGGKNWTVISTTVLLIPTIGIGFAVQNPETPYYVLVILAALCGLGGGNLSSSTANINAFFPKHAKGTANGINVGIGNLGVSVVQFVTPIAIGIGFIGMMTGGPQVLANGSEVFIQNAAFIWVVPIVAAILLAAFGMDNLPNAKQSFKEQIVVLKHKHMWIMTWLYVMCFGSFIGYSAAFPLLIRSEFPEINAVQLAFLGPFVGATLRPLGGWISDKVNSGAMVTHWTIIVMILATGGVVYFLNMHNFMGFLIMFLILFAGTGVANGSTFRMVPFIFDGKQAGPVLGFTAAFGAYGAFFIPKIFGWSIETTGSANLALYLFIGYYVSSLVVCWYWYSRKGAEVKC
ncbi:MFS transporter [Ammoniphilus sp. YIM 78166]|uniref:MFS transporter n=1 Tax=Ammoniphilus sp. YIM 78166 TaxID=1644106 RepID=UPI001070171A|nr:MFS transporter [Ammoniphilus sp. YIM 78166]